METITIILDLDGVLITTPIWKPDLVDEVDQYSKFDEQCIDNLNVLLSKCTCEIWLSSTRRTVKTLEEFNIIFKNRNIRSPICGFLPEYTDCKTRKEEIVKFIQDYEVTNFLILDDDRSLNGLHIDVKKRLILTQYIKGFNLEKLKLALEIIDQNI